MKKQIINRIKTALFLSFVPMVVMQVTSCKEAEMQVFNEKSAIYFPTYEEPKRGIDSAYISFFQNPGKEQLSVPFKVMLIGNLLTEDTEYRLQIVDSMTTALPNEYALPEKLFFRKGMPTDTVFVTVFKRDRLSTTDARVVFEIVENENFRAGYSTKQRIKLRFDNIISRPGWWDKSIEFIYLGKFSVEKYELFIQISGGKITTEGLEAWELRQICLDMIEYIDKNGITEKDGSPMEIVCY